MRKRTREAIVQCPTCTKRGPWFDKPFGPFCSHRCKMIDLGKWLGEEHTISEPLRPEHFEGNEDLATDELRRQTGEGGLQ
jgi:endogenous inhibitor of DNA gyrase (YacG/DUF329 family)